METGGSHLEAGPGEVNGRATWPVAAAIQAAGVCEEWDASRAGTWSAIPGQRGEHGPHTVPGRRIPITGMDRPIGSGFMICRVWRGWTTKDNADAYERVVQGEVIPGIAGRRIPGFRSIDLVRRERDHDVEFMTLMWFDTIDAVKAFMGADYESAHVPEQAQAVLADFDRRSAHYEVLDRREQPL